MKNETERELRPGQIYEQKWNESRRVKIQKVDKRSGEVWLVRVGPAPASAIGRRTVRQIDSFRRAFRFFLEERIVGYCVGCNRALKVRDHYDESLADFRDDQGRCFDCATRTGMGRKR